MWYYLLKLTISALVIVAVSEIAKRHSGLAALVAALPLTSLLAFVWMYIEGTPMGQISELSQQIFWLVIPSLFLFLLFPILIKFGLAFWPSLGLAVITMLLFYWAMLPLLRRFGVIINYG